MGKWEKVRLGDICTIVSGTTPKSNVEHYWNGSLNWVTPAELDEDTIIIIETQRKITVDAVRDSSLKPFPVGTVLLSSRAPIGKVAIAGTQMYCNQGFKNLICSSVIHNKFLFWYLRGKNDYLNSLGRGATFKEISKSIVENIFIPLPPIDQQCKIAATLDAVADLLKMRKQQLAELDKLMKSQFIEMFGDPVTNPMEWAVRRLGDVFTIIDGDRGEHYPKGTDFIDAGYCAFLNAGNVTASGFDFSIVQFVTEEKDRQLRKGRFERQDIVVTTRGTVGNVAVYSDNVPYEIMRINSGMVLLRNYKDVINPEYFILLVRGFALTKSFLSGSAQPQLPIANMKKILLPLPPLPLQNRFADFVRQVDQTKAAIQQAIHETQALFDSLMSEYFA